MIYLYDNAIVDDLNKSFNSDISDPVVKVISPENIIGVAAQLQEDHINFSVISLEREDPVIDSSRANFVAMHRGVPAVFDSKTNNIYNERSLPINLSYQLTVLTTNQEDMDEIIRELLFKYVSMYFLSVKIPYESKRVISFGVVIDQDAGISRRSGSSEYTSSGQLYQTVIKLNCEGCVLVTYTPNHLRRNVNEVGVDGKSVDFYD